MKSEARAVEALDKANKDLARLRAHLIELEEAHTLDEVNKEEQISELRQQ